MRTFIFHYPCGLDELYLKLERVEANLATTQKAVADGSEMLKLAKGKKGAIWAEADLVK